MRAQVVSASQTTIFTKEQEMNMFRYHYIISVLILQFGTTTDRRSRVFTATGTSAYLCDCCSKSCCCNHEDCPVTRLTSFIHNMFKYPFIINGIWQTPLSIDRFFIYLIHTSEQLMVQGLAQGPHRSNLVVLGFNLTTFWSVVSCFNH